MIIVRLLLLVYILWLLRDALSLGLPGVILLCVVAWLILPEPEPPPRE